MREIPEDVRAILQSKTMIGANKPTYDIDIEGMVPRIDEVKITSIGTSNETQYSNYSFSNFIPTNDGRFLCCWIDENNTLSCGYTNDESFFYTPYPIDEESVINYSNITVVNTPKDNLVLFKRDDGKILLFINDYGDLGETASLKCYISNTGNGDDFEYYSTVFELDISDISHKTFTDLGCQIPIQSNGRIIINACNVYKITERGYTYCTVYVFTSDDNGLTWETRVRFGAGYGSTLPHSFSQIVKIPSGDLYWEITYSSTSHYLIKSIDNGTTWQYISDDRYSEDFGNLQIKNAWRPGLFYDSEKNVVYRFSYGDKNGEFQHLHVLPNPTPAKIEDKTNWQYITGHDSFLTNDMYRLWKTPSGKIGVNIKRLSNNMQPTTWILGWRESKYKLPITKIDINRAKGMAGSATIELANTNGEFAPDGDKFPHLLWTNKKIIIKQGYGNNLVQTFTGYIDSVRMDTFPQMITIYARDGLKKALDQLITTNEGKHTITFKNKSVEDIFRTLAEWAGIPTGTIESTGLNIAEKQFSWETYADAFSWLEELVEFETVCDENGLIHFRRDGKPDEVEIAYEFEEGENIISLGYDIDDRDIYYAVVVQGQKKVGDKKVGDKEEVIEFRKEYPARKYWNINPQKIMVINAPEADTEEKCEIIADRAIYLMNTRVRKVEFEAIAVPYLQVGDFILVKETSTTISEVYRITNLGFTQDINGYTMRITCYHHGTIPNENGGSVT